ncbi:T-cell surface glycoprotein CD3 epsilon chain isoform X1 [Manis pentadactyla]|uniref:T-cell surface glycoprotein CD3 epsilon chain isoform X1 n=1 Tax=Manis pentadactyla TaxID=143292 RepID=UPI001874E18C|nr:T-cell surface glycoprotein CD3 epsilon chain isoform X1 [Manis pentadactyla]XP_036775802.1 T-cell surface glycoprotein CD3 epsilon chain isoform X1 [Manis pentadactyla]KAI5282537.1 T-Cell Surface Glycoprotein Cd3 Epsilon Chain [Manis pentadactyla]
MSCERRMPSRNLWTVLGLCLLSVGAWGQEDNEDNDENIHEQRTYKVSISGTKVTLTCLENSESEAIKWAKDNVELPGPFNENKQLELEDFSEVENSGYYACYTSSSKEKNHYLYLKARVCESCMEVDLMAVVTIIIVDICITLGLLLLVYYWSKNRKAKAKPVTRGTGAGGRPRGQNKERPPPVPNPDYEPIRKGQHDLYSGLNQRGI